MIHKFVKKIYTQIQVIYYFALTPGAQKGFSSGGGIQINKNFNLKKIIRAIFGLDCDSLRVGFCSPPLPTKNKSDTLLNETRRTPHPGCRRALLKPAIVRRTAVGGIEFLARVDSNRLSFVTFKLGNPKAPRIVRAQFLCSRPHCKRIASESHNISIRLYSARDGFRVSLTFSRPEYRYPLLYRRPIENRNDTRDLFIFLPSAHNTQFILSVWTFYFRKLYVGTHRRVVKCTISSGRNFYKRPKTKQ